MSTQLVIHNQILLIIFTFGLAILIYNDNDNSLYYIDTYEDWRYGNNNNVLDSHILTILLLIWLCYI